MTKSKKEVQNEFYVEHVHNSMIANYGALTVAFFDHPKLFNDGVKEYRTYISVDMAKKKDKVIRLAKEQEKLKYATAYDLYLKAKKEGASGVANADAQALEIEALKKQLAEQQKLVKASMSEKEQVKEAS